MCQVDSEQFEKILRYIRAGVDSGATLETGGDRLGEKGYYIKPTVFSNVQVSLFGGETCKFATGSFCMSLH